MAVNISYRLDIYTKWSTQASGSFDCTSLDGRGYAYIGDRGSHLAGVISPPSGVIAAHLSPNNGSWNDITGQNATIAQLKSGSLVVAAESAGSIVLQLFNQGTGADLTASIDLGLTNRSNPDAAALSNGLFFVACENTPSSGNGNIEILMRDAAGGFVDAFEIANGPENDGKPSIAALDGGGAAVAWTRTKGNGSTEAWFAVLDNNGNYVKGPTLIDSTGSINRNVSVTAMDNGGFAVAYEDNGWATGTVDITVATFAADGVFGNWFNAGGASDDEQPSLTRFSNGFLGLISGDNTTARTEQVIRLLDPAHGVVLAQATISSNQGGGYDDTASGTIADIGVGRLVGIYDRNALNVSIGNQTLVQAVRISDGDAAANTFITYEYSAVMYGRGGDDVLRGGINRDWLYGGLGSDNLTGGSSRDVLQGGLGGDRLRTGDGHDRIVYESVDESLAGRSRDIIHDFAVWPSAEKYTIDRIDVSGIDPDLDTEIDEAFTFVGSNPFNHGAQIRAYQSGLDTIIAIDADGGGVDMEIVLRDFTAALLTSDDFVL